MNKVLVAVDAADPDATTAALAHALRMHAEAPIEVHLLSVQPAVNGHVAMFFDSGELHDLHRAAGAEELAPALTLLRSHDVPCTSSVRIGRRADTIARAARELACDRIVLGREGGAGSLAGRVFGSLAQQVRQLMAGSAGCQVIGA